MSIDQTKRRPRSRSSSRDQATQRPGQLARARSVGSDIERGLYWASLDDENTPVARQLALLIRTALSDERVLSQIGSEFDVSWWIHLDHTNRRRFSRVLAKVAADTSLPLGCRHMAAVGLGILLLVQEGVPSSLLMASLYFAWETSLRREAITEIRGDVRTVLERAGLDGDTQEFVAKVESGEIALPRDEVAVLETGRKTLDRWKAARTFGAAPEPRHHSAPCAPSIPTSAPITSLEGATRLNATPITRPPSVRATEDPCTFRVGEEDLVLPRREAEICQVLIENPEGFDSVKVLATVWRSLPRTRGAPPPSDGAVAPTYQRLAKKLEQKAGVPVLVVAKDRRSGVRRYRLLKP
jgi:hypothetical protein